MKTLRDMWPGEMDTKAGTVIDIDDAETVDLVVGQRIYMPANIGWWLEQDPGRLIYEIDDDLWRVHPSSPAHRMFGRPEVGVRLKAAVCHAGAVTVSTEQLADVIRPMNSNVHVLPNFIDEALLAHERPRAEKLTVGWAGSATHLVDFREAQAGLTRFFGKYPAVDMHIISEMDYSPLIKRRARITPWIKGVDAYHRSIDFDIGIAPLASQEFNASKSHVKALEYAALGIPIVASDFGPYRDFVQHGVTGFLCRYDHEWFKYLRMLTEDESLREQMGKAAKEQAAQHTIQGHAHKWRAVYEQAR